jgi:hypothetical protein
LTPHRRKGNWLIVAFDTAGEVIFTEASQSANQPVERAPSVDSGLFQTSPAVSLGFVDVPAVSNLAVTPFAQGLCQMWSQPAFPRPHRFMSKHDTTLEEHFGKVPQAELVPEAPQHHQSDHIGGILQPIKRRAGPFVKPPVTGPIAKAAVP